MATKHLIAFDPGTANMGMAHFYRGVFVDGVYLARPDPFDIVAVAHLWSEGEPAEWVREKMTLYPKKRSKHVDLKAIEALCKKVSQVGQPFTRELPPRVWKANVVKKVHHDRLRRALSPQEQLVWDKLESGDIRDACGIGLFALGRVKRGGILA